MTPARVIDYIMVAGSGPATRYLDEHGWAKFIRDKVRVHFDWYGDAMPRVLVHLPFPVDAKPPMELEAWDNAPEKRKRGFAQAWRTVGREAETMAYLGTISGAPKTPHPFAPAWLKDPTKWDELIRWLWRNVEPIERAGMGLVLDRSIGGWSGFVHVLAERWYSRNLPFGIEPAPTLPLDVRRLPHNATVFANDRFGQERDVLRAQGHQYVGTHQEQDPAGVLATTLKILRSGDTACVSIARLKAAGVDSYERLMEGVG